jgi:2-dehydro-3-deoxygalactonokinase
MRFILVDWGTSRFRAFLVGGEAILDRVASDEGVSALREGQHREVFLRHCRPWLEREPEAPVALVGMVGSREGWRMAPYAECPAGPEEIARAMIEVEIDGARRGHIVPGLMCEPEAGTGTVDVMRGEETLCLGAGVADGLVCLPGTHPKWVEMAGGRIARFATYFTGEMYGLLRHHSMVGRPATEPEDPEGFERGLDAAERNGRSGRVGLLHLIFGARAAAVTGRLPTAQLAPYISGLLTGDEIAGAFSLFEKPRAVTAIGDPGRISLFAKALARHEVEVASVPAEQALIAGLARILAHHRI